MWRNMNRILLTVLIISLLGCTQHKNTPPKLVDTFDRGQVYRTILDSSFSVDLPSETYYIRESYAEIPSSEEMPTIRDAFEGYDFLSDKKKHKKEDFEKRDVTLIRQSEIEELFANGCETGWEKLFQKYTKSRMLLGFSNIAVKSDGNHAAIYCEIGSDCMRGMGSIAYLSRTSNNWTISSTMYIWGGY
jgi:hypothetical protein